LGSKGGNENIKYFLYLKKKKKKRKKRLFHRAKWSLEQKWKMVAERYLIRFVYERHSTLLLLTISFTIVVTPFFPLIIRSSFCFSSFCFISCHHQPGALDLWLPGLAFKFLFIFFFLSFYSIVSCHNINWTSGHHILLPSVAHPPAGVGRGVCARVSNHMGPICVSCSLDSFTRPNRC
jgi:hypothetical protein